MKFRKFLILTGKKFSAAYKAFLAAVGADGGTVEAKAYTDALLQTASNASIVQIPSAYKAAILYNQVPTPTGQDFTVARASDVWRTNEDGFLEVIGSNVPCIDYSDGFPVLLTQPQSTNLYLNNETLSTQNVTTSAIPYTVSFYGTGTITFTGTHTGSLVGTGVSDRVQVTFTPTAGTLTSTVSGTVTKGQIEALGYATTPITTTGATATRLGDVITGAGSTSSINSEEGVLHVEMAALADTLIQRSISLSDGGATDTFILIVYRNTSEGVTFQVRNNGVSVAVKQIVLADTTVMTSFDIKWKVNDFEFYVDGVSVGTDVSGATIPANQLNELSFTDRNGISFFYGKTKQLRVYSSIAAATIDLPYIT